MDGDTEGRTRRMNNDSLGHPKRERVYIHCAQGQLYKD